MKVNVKKALATMMAAALIVTSAQCPTASAAKKPKLNSKKVTLTVGKKKTLKVKNKIKGSTYTWKSSKVKVAKVTKKGVVKAVKAGTATITCKVKTKATKKKKAKTYTLKCKVTVKKKKTTKPTAKPTAKPTTKPSTKPSDVPSNNPSDTPSQAPSDNPSTAPSTEPSVSPSADPSASPSVSPSVSPSASPTTTPSYNYRPGGSSSKPGTSATPSTSPTSAPDGTVVVASQADLDNALKSATKPTTLKIESEELTSLTIAEGTYSETDVIVNAPKATITNSATFNSVTIEAISSDTWIEKAVGNALKIIAKSAHVQLDSGAKPTSIDIEAPEDKSVTPDVKITTNGGTADAVNVTAVVNLTIAKGDSAATGSDALSVNVKITGETKDSKAAITSSIPVAITTETSASVDITLKTGAESSTVTVDKADQDGATVTVTNNTTQNVTVTNNNAENETNKTQTAAPNGAPVIVEVKADPDKALIAKALEELTETVVLNGNTTSDFSKANLKLPKKSDEYSETATGASISWTVSPTDNGVLDLTTGQITPAATDTTITLTATITAGKEKETKEFGPYTIKGTGTGATVTVTALTITYTAVSGSATTGSSITVSNPNATLSDTSAKATYKYAISTEAADPTKVTDWKAISDTTTLATDADISKYYLWVKVTVDADDTYFVSPGISIGEQTPSMTIKPDTN